MCKEDLTLNNLQWLICHKTQPNQKNHLVWWLNRYEIDSHQALLTLCLNYPITNIEHSISMNIANYIINIYIYIYIYEYAEV